MTYLDANATEPLRPAARAALLEALAVTGNPSSVHAAGRRARRVLEEARDAIAAAFGAPPAGVVFTSGGTEANSLAIHALGLGRQVIVGATEHPAIRAAAPGGRILPVDDQGRAILTALPSLLAAGPALVCLMLANNETGVIHPIAEAARICREAGALLHVDAVQAAGRIPVTLAALGADSLALSGHKMGGVPGAGALLLAGDLAVPPLIAGGGQERGRRGGTPALPAIAAFAAAAADACANPPGLGSLRDAIEQAAIGAGAVVLGASAPRLPNTTCLALPGARAETQVIALDLAGFQVSAGAACSSGKAAASEVVAAMGHPDLAACSLRVSLPWNATAGDAHGFADAYVQMAGRLSRQAA
jgi:cysteine desulfurase